MRNIRVRLRRAISLVELMVVILIIGILLSLLIPALQSARRSARSIQCANNLHQIGMAFKHYEERMGEAQKIPVGGWMPVLLKGYLERNRAALICPEGFEDGATSAAHVILRENKDGESPKQVVLFADGPNCRKTVKGEGSYDLWFKISDHAEWNDFGIHIDETAEGLVTVKILTPLNAGIDSWLYSPTDDLILVTHSLTSPMGLTATYPTDKFPFSYGMNSQTPKFSGGDANRILALDYHLRVADCAGPKHADKWSTSVAPRHSKMCNVLSYDTSVRTMNPDNIDPDFVTKNADGTDAKDTDGNIDQPNNKLFWTPARGVIVK